MSETTTLPIVWGGWDAAIRDDPFPLFGEMRTSCPVHEVRLADGHDAWLVLGHDEAREALNDRRMSKDMLAALDGDPSVVAGGLPGPAFSRHMLNVDPPDHTRLRKLVAGAFLPTRVAALEPAIGRMANALLDELEAAGPGAAVDLVEGYAHTLPFAVIGELLGVPAGDRPALHGWFQTLFRPWAGDFPPEAVAASDSLVAYLAELVAAKRSAPGDDLVSLLVSASDGGDRLSQQELLSSLFQLIVAGHDTTTSLIGNGVVALLDRPDQLAMLVADPSLLPVAVEEMLRFCAAVPHATFRMTTEVVDIGGTTIPASRQVLVGLGAANRDPRRWTGPDRFDINRAPRPHLAFGHGIHYCLGAPLARLEARVAFRTLLGRFPRLRLAVPRADLAWDHGDGLVLRGLSVLPVHLTHQQPSSTKTGESDMTITETPVTPVDNGVNVEALMGARKMLSEQPAAAQFTWRASCTWKDGTHSHSVVETFAGLGGEQSHRTRFEYDVDHPECFASKDQGATPVELVLVGLAGCLTAGVASVAQLREIQLRSVSATIEGDMDVLGILGGDPHVRNGFQDIRIHFAIDADAKPEDIEALVAQSQKRSAVYDVITNPTNVTVSVN